ncbi:Mss4-like protein [Phaeosphaeria sp. MPI-PUGE-AT-0046c]|nr:Mss4-like protein [Phaeosphaeria sp. MPI-PUGE-AT-0046c]
MATTDDNITLTAHCLCRANKYEATVSKSKLPLHAYICHCDSCRHVTGALHSACLRWPVPRADVNVSALKVYQHFTKINLLFCPTCSTPMFFADREDTNRLLGVFPGILSNNGVDLVKFGNQVYVFDTQDGGAAVWLRHNADGSAIVSFKHDDEPDVTNEVPPEWPPSAQLTGYSPRKEETIPIRCKCEGVDLRLHAGDYSKFQDHELPFNIDPKTHKLLAGFCGCDSCRLQSGIDVFNWAFAEMKYISIANDDKSFPTTATELKNMVDAKDPALGTLKYYSSREDVDRYFCSNCSACVFYAVTSRPEHLDIAVGVLRASDGARAEGFLSWPYGARISYREDGDGGWREKLFDNVEKAAEEYRVARGYSKNWNRVAKDENGGRSPK